MEKFSRDFLDLLRSFAGEDVRFLIVGAFAVAVHAEPRATGDLDVWVEPTAENAARVYRALSRFGAPLNDLTVEDLASPDIVFQMGLPPNRIDVMTSVSGLRFSSAWKDRVKIKFRGVRLSVLGRGSLLRNKRAAARPKDLIDLELLKKHGRRSIKKKTRD